MVNNLRKVLDEEKIKYVPEINMEKYPDYVRNFMVRVHAYKSYCNDRNLSYYHKNSREPEFIQGWADNVAMGILPTKAKGSFDRIAKFMDVKPFRPHVMINISPAWKGKFGQDKTIDKIMVKGFKKIIETYLNSADRYSDWKYCLENGSNGDFLHAHIVAEINFLCEKSVKTHINKGNHKYELMKHWDKNFKGNEGLLKGKFAVQRILLNNENLVKDKIDYLDENLKPEGHKNHCNLNLVFGKF